MNWLRIGAETDESLSVLERLLDAGYTNVKWIVSSEPCAICRDLEDKEWDLKDFISGLDHEAPVFEHGHVNDRCELEVSGPDLETIRVNFEGII